MTFIFLDQYSQVCQVINNDYRNFGSILTSFQAQDDIITAQFVSGSTCLENSTLLYSTHIELKCSKSEKGPQFQQIKNCVMFIFWETPHACPVDVKNIYFNLPAFLEFFLVVQRS